MRPPRPGRDSIIGGLTGFVVVVVAFAIYGADWTPLAKIAGLMVDVVALGLLARLAMTRLRKRKEKAS